MTDSAANNLKGITLKTGWTVIEKITKDDNSTGSVFSICYKVKKNDNICFLKAFNFTPFFQLSEQSGQNRSITDIIGDMINAYKYERDLSKHCKMGHVTKVAFVIDSGEEIIPNFSINIVPYLIFELADGDVRHNLQYSERLDLAWKLNSLREVATGLKQLHNVNVSHQDLKPSNILLFDKESKIGDLGRSMCKDIENQYNNQIYSGDWNYAPPELMYGYYEQDWEKRAYATDCYLLGSMVVFYFAGISMSALLLKHIPNEFRWENYRGSFDEVKPYLIAAFGDAMTEFSNCIELEYFRNELKQIVEYLCFPFPEKRGHPKNIASVGNSYSLERFITKFELLRRKAELNIKTWQQ
ncbi:MAG: protein kinase [Bacteroidales bacterium]|nr:protein kinase [Bacteroidales bacterium]